jgi:ParB-like chromosome segregation protein Spo0J
MKKTMPEGKWPGAAVEMRDLSALTPWEGNPRHHSEDQIHKIAASIREFGWTIPVVVDTKGTILAGHGRVMAAYELNLKRVPVITARGWSESQKRAYVLADNKLTELSTWNQEALTEELQRLVTDGFDIEVTGFDMSALEAAIEPTGKAGEQQAVECPNCHHRFYP